MPDLIFKTLDWQIAKEYSETEEVFYINGITKEEKSVLLKVDGFTPFVYLELPSSVSWSKINISYLTEFLYGSLPLGAKPVKVSEKLEKLNLYHKVPTKCLRVVFKTHKACKGLQYFFGKSQMIPCLGQFDKDVFKVHEQNIDQLIKLTAVRKLKLGSWIRVDTSEKAVKTKKEKVFSDLDPDQEPPSDEDADEGNESSSGFSSTDIDLQTNYKNLYPITIADSVQPRYKILSFDLECRSSNHDSKNPDPTNPKNDVIQISGVFARANEPEKLWKKYLLTQKKGVDIKLEGVIVIPYPNEKKLLIGFSKLVKKLDPDIMTGYNILKFDWDYLIKRSEFRGVFPQFANIGRVDGVLANVITKDWESSAYGKQVFQYLEPQGRLNLDLMVEVERKEKFDTYSLDFVAKHYLGDSKKEMPIKQMFILYDFACDVQNFFEYTKDGTVSKQHLADIKEIARNAFSDESGLLADFLLEILKAERTTILGIVSKAMQFIGDYCVHDSVLVMRLLFKIRTLLDIEQMANIFCVPISYLQTRGQQIKIVAQVFRHTLYNNFIIPFKGYDPESDEKYQGATVIDAKPGLWEKIATFDFESLYPSVMIANNLDYTTYIDPKNDDTPDGMCNIMEFESHRGCEHDKEIRKTKVKKELILCGHFKHKFLKVIEKADGTKVNEGIMPFLLRNLLTERKKVKAEIKELSTKLKEDANFKTFFEDKKLYKNLQNNSLCEKDIQKIKNLAEKLKSDKNKILSEKDIEDFTKKLKDHKLLSEEEIKNANILLNVLDAKQLALKISANSMYGATGAVTGFMPLIPIASSTTAGGRQYIHIAINYILKNFRGSKLVYGDSVTGDTPILVRDTLTGVTQIVEIKDIGDAFREFPNFKPPHLEPLTKEDEGILNYVDQEKWGDAIHIENLATKLMLNKTIRSEKEMSETLYEVYTDEGWKKINKVIRHKVNKNIYRVETDYGKVDVTEDHSLLDENKNKIKPNGINFNTKLLRSLPAIKELNFSAKDLKDIEEKWEKNLIISKKDEQMLFYYSVVNNFKINQEPFCSITNLGKTTDFVYDLETENGRFQAGIGQLIVKNTDSCMIHFDGLNLKEVFEISKKIAKEVTSLFPPPVNLQFECVYGKYFLLTKKRYIAYKFDEEGKIYEKTKKGVVSKRRDNTHFLKNVYNQLTEDVMDITDEKKIFYDIYDNVQKLFTLQVPQKDLVISKSIKDLVSYALKVKLPDPSGKKDRKGKPLMIVYLMDKDKQPMFDKSKKPLNENVRGVSTKSGKTDLVFPPLVIKSAMDPRLSFRNDSHIMLALKMLRRGDEIPPNTRLQYVFLDTGNSKELQGLKAEEWTYFKENKKKKNLKLDPLYYLEKQLSKPITEIINVLYRTKKVKYETLDVKIKRYEDAIFAKLDKQVIENIIDMRQFIFLTFKTIPKKDTSDYKARVKITKSQVNRLKNEKISSAFDTLVNLYYVKKSEKVMEKIEHAFGIKKKPNKKYDKKTGMIVLDGVVMENILKARTTYQESVRHLKKLFYTPLDQEVYDKKKDLFARMRKERLEKIKALENKKIN